ncbi:hypothetical protein [Virgibacillus oceani]|uniref:t-SNARE coiled-coil homology domain-containing protein n=1 Tax=Virgibacillus oceani TaxID=1479511 RepID=A0A917M6C0_9BACI|nr:hypothetical protein [Virgibacillus oceani]GGG80156.1 hypothetical protein GCM10011398_26950 [Virgibacillus oceani]
MDKEFKESFDKIFDRLDGVDKNIEQMNVRFDGVDKNIEQMNTRFDGIDHNIGEINNRLDKMDGRFDTIENDVKDVKAGQERMQKNIIASLGEYTDRIVSHFDDRTEALNKRTFAVETKIERLHK